MCILLLALLVFAGFYLDVEATESLTKLSFSHIGGNVLNVYV
jgi:hypothetical protein